MIIFNDLISKFYQCSIRGFCQSISMFFSICLGEKCLCSIKKVIFVFHKTFNLDFITQIINCIIHRCLYSLFILFCSFISVSEKRYPSLSIQLAKSQKQINEKKPEYQSMCPQYLTRQVNSCILQLLLRRFCRMIFALS